MSTSRSRVRGIRRPPEDQVSVDSRVAHTVGPILDLGRSYGRRPAPRRRCRCSHQPCTMPAPSRRILPALAAASMGGGSSPPRGPGPSGRRSGTRPRAGFGLHLGDSVGVCSQLSESSTEVDPIGDRGDPDDGDQHDAEPDETACPAHPCRDQKPGADHGEDRPKDRGGLDVDHTKCVEQRRTRPRPARRFPR